MVGVAVVCADAVVAAASSRAETLRTTQEETEIVPRIKNSILPIRQLLASSFGLSALRQQQLQSPRCLSSIFDYAVSHRFVTWPKQDTGAIDTKDELGGNFGSTQNNS